MESVSFLKKCCERLTGNNHVLYILILWFWLLLFFSTFVFTLLPPQYGWWNYYAQQITEAVNRASFDIPTEELEIPEEVL